MKKAFMISVPLICLAVCIAGIFMKGAFWILPITFALQLLGLCIPIAIFRYILKRGPIKRAKLVSLCYALLPVYSILSGLNMNPSELVATLAGVIIGTVINYMMLSE